MTKSDKDFCLFICDVLKDIPPSPEYGEKGLKMLSDRLKEIMEKEQ